MSTKIQKVNDGIIQSPLDAVETLLDSLAKDEALLETRYAKLGNLLVVVSRDELWRPTYESWGKYILHLAEKYNMGRTQLYAYFSSAKALLPYVSEDNLNAMGISKAKEIAKATKNRGATPERAIIEAACKEETTVEDVRRLLFEKYNLPAPDAPKGEWMDFQGFYVSTEERAVINAAFDAAKRQDPPIQPGIPDHVARKEVILRLSMEFLNTYGANAEKEYAELTEQDEDAKIFTLTPGVDYTEVKDV